MACVLVLRFAEIKYFCPKAAYRGEGLFWFTVSDYFPLLQSCQGRRDYKELATSYPQSGAEKNKRMRAYLLS